MATLTASDFYNKIKQSPVGTDSEVVAVFVNLAVIAARSAGDIIPLFWLPAGHVPVDFWIAPTDMDTGTSMTFSFGILKTDLSDISTTAADGGAAWLANSTAAQTGVLARPTTTAFATVTPDEKNDRPVGIKITAHGSNTAGNFLACMLYRRSLYGA